MLKSRFSKVPPSYKIQLLINVVRKSRQLLFPFRSQNELCIRKVMLASELRAHSPQRGLHVLHGCMQAP